MSWTGSGRPVPWSATPHPNDVVVLGYSQGGQAALFAGEIAQTYAPELYVAGVAAARPVTSVLELAPHRCAATTVGPVGVHRHGPLRMGAPLPDLLPRQCAHPGGHRREISVVATSCIDGVASLYDAVSPLEVLPPGMGRVPAIQAANQANQPGGAPTSAPILVIQGTSDEVVPFKETTDFVARTAVPASTTRSTTSSTRATATVRCSGSRPP